MNKKRIFLIIAIIVIIIAGEIVLRNQLKAKQTAEIFPDATTSAVIQNNFETAIVARVIDGDTIELTDKRHVRYTGIDTPESTDRKKPVECYGRESAEENKRLVDGKTVRLEKDITDVDTYGRLLRYVFVDDIFINDILVKNGFARVTIIQPDVHYQDVLLSSQLQAKNFARGLWQACHMQ